MLSKANPFLFVFLCIMTTGCQESPASLGENEAIRVYTEFADGGNRGMYDPETDSKGFPDEDYDATTAMVINWHRLPEKDTTRDARLRYRRIHPSPSSWETVTGESFPFWFREEKVNRVVLTGLEPNSVYEFSVKEDGRLFRLRTMPSNLDDRPVKIIMTADHQSPSWSEFAHANAKMAGLQKPDMFIVAGDFLNDEGAVNQEIADRWAMYLDLLYGIEDGYLLYDDEIDGQIYENIVTPHLSALGNHETGEAHHLRWPSCVSTTSSEPGYPQYVSANWMELLFQWPYSSEGFYSEFNPRHPNMNSEKIKDGFGRGGFGKLSFSDYLLFISLDNSQNWEGEPEKGLRDWEGNLITERWPWYEEHHSDVRQDLWLKNLLEPEGKPRAGETYTHILPVWHRGLFGTVRQNMSLKNRPILKYWLPLLHRNGVKLIKEGHDHNYTRTVPMSISSEQPPNTYLEKVYYEPLSWELTSNLPQQYLDDFYAVNAIKDNKSREITGWEYDGNYITYHPAGMIATGHGGWAGGRIEPGARNGGNAGMWFVDKENGGVTYGGEASFHIHTIHLSNNEIQVEVFYPDQVSHFEMGTEPPAVHKYKWDLHAESWFMFDESDNSWNKY